MPRTFALAGCLLVTICSAGADLGPDQVFREYVWRGPWVNAGGWQRVTDPDAPHAGAQAHLPNPVNEIVIDDLAGAIRAEAYLEMWGGHAGTSARRMRLNGHPWLPVPKPEAIPGDAGTVPDFESYQTFSYPAVPLPLAQLRQGTNRFEFTSGPQITYDFGWGQWGVYGVTFRVYYDDSKARISARVVSPAPGETIGEDVALQVETDADSAVERIDFIGLYEDFDFEGNGVYRQWHLTYRYGRPDHHLGSAAAPDDPVVWNTEWIPDQSQPMAVMARVVDAAGLHHTTPAVEGLVLRRGPRSVRLYKPYDVPGRWQTRAGRTDRARVFVPHDLSQAVDARLLMVTWSGGHADAIGINGEPLVARVGRAHDYSYDEIDVPLSLLRAGTNETFTHAATEHHGIEVMWPGMGLKVRYAGLPLDDAQPTRDEAILAEDLAPGWTTRAAHQIEARIGPDSRAPTGRALTVAAQGFGWRYELAPPSLQGLAGYRSLRLSLRPDSLAVNRFTWMRVGIGDRFVELVSRSSDADDLIDLSDPSWQAIEIPVDAFGLPFPYLESLHFTGSFVGTFQLADIRLVASSPTAVAEAGEAVPATSALMPNYPNPFNQQTRLRYSLSKAGFVELRVLNATGQRLAVLVDGWRPAGQHEVVWDGRDAAGRRLASGVYLHRLVTPSTSTTRRLLLLR